jgi:hypothetical protein
MPTTMRIGFLPRAQHTGAEPQEDFRLFWCAPEENDHAPAL